MKLVIISGRSGTGKSVALHALEDVGYYAIDNLPASMLLNLATRACDDRSPEKIAVSIDARNILTDLIDFPDIYNKLKNTCIDTSIIFLQAKTSVLVERFSSTRRKHPLATNREIALTEALSDENALLLPISEVSYQTIDTTYLTSHDLRSLVVSAVTSTQETLIQIKSFGFKQGIPVDADLIFDARCLDNPYWDLEFRSLTGKDQKVADFLLSKPKTQDFLQDIKTYLNRWLPEYINSQRAYITIAVGCTGGQHRSVFVAETLAKYFLEKYQNLQVRHRDLSPVE